MRLLKWTLVILVANCIPGWPQSPPSPLSQTIGEQAQSVGPRTADPDFAEARRLLQQGKYDEAVSQLSDLAGKKPGLKGLSFELGLAYYQKGDYLKAIEALK
ncbi:MAG TPA: tetratricopeptide repeat protein, partial [Terriglobales bacterium]|nr:tetratricopeptide repeat protein [Terriglobales bacterium]